MTMELRRVADECCEGRLVVVTEGGYDLRALAESLRAVVSVLSLDRAAAPDGRHPTSVAVARSHAVAAATRQRSSEAAGPLAVAAHAPRAW